MLSDYHYREICRKKSTGQGGITWKFYWEIHQFLGTLPVNDRSLTEEIGCGPGETVDQVNAICMLYTLWQGHCRAALSS